MRQIDALEKALKENGIQAAKWEKNGKSRIYFNGLGKDIKAFLELDDPNGESDVLYFGCVLKVFSDVTTQPSQWVVNRRKQVAHGLASRMFEAGIFKGVSDEPPCADWKDIILS